MLDLQRFFSYRHKPFIMLHKILDQRKVFLGWSEEGGRHSLAVHLFECSLEYFKMYSTLTGSPAHS